MRASKVMGEIVRRRWGPDGGTTSPTTRGSTYDGHERHQDVGHVEARVRREQHGRPDRDRCQVCELENDDQGDRRDGVRPRDLGRLQTERPGGRDPDEKEADRVSRGHLEELRQRPHEGREDDDIHEDDPPEQAAAPQRRERLAERVIHPDPHPGGPERDDSGDGIDVSESAVHLRHHDRADPSHERQARGKSHL